MLRQMVREVLEAGTKARGHIFNVGHGLQPHTPPDSVAIAIDEVRRFEAERAKQAHG
jgi:uroporphyrinogen decarboxylase